ncbi:MAG: SRPBCC family protein [Dehalococcoidia bacterium]
MPTDVTVPEGGLEMHVTRQFDHPIERVWQAFTQPAHLRQWMGPRGYEVTESEVDLRPGGNWRMVHRAPDGQTYSFHGEYQEIEPPRRIVQTFIFDGTPDDVVHETMTLESQGTGTIFRGTSRFPSRESMDGMLEAGMVDGMKESYDRLAEHLAASRART